VPWDVPSFAVLIDLPLGILMWLAVCRFVLLIFIGEDSRTPVMRILNATIGPLLRAIESAGPSWLSYRIVPLLLVGIILVLRYYLMPIVFGYEVRGITDLPLENLIAGAVSEIGR